MNYCLKVMLEKVRAKGLTLTANEMMWKKTSTKRGSQMEKTVDWKLEGLIILMMMNTW